MGGRGGESFQRQYLFNDYLSTLLDHFDPGSGIYPRAEFTPAAWAREKHRILENRRLNIEEDPFGMMHSYDDINV